MGDDMFEELLEEYKKLTLDSKREKNVEEIKLVLAMLQLLCERRKINHPNLKIIDLENYYDENDYLDLMHTYIITLKEELGSYVLHTESDNN